jgi:hypothetical protein
MSSIAVFLVLGGATAFAASQLGRNSVGSKQLKRNAVTAAKIKKNAVTKTKIKKNSIDSSKVADGSLTGADINAGSTPFSQVVYKARGTGAVALPNGGGGLYPLSNATYTQAANRDDMYIGALDVTIQSTCTGTRSVVVYILIDPANPSVPTINDVVATGQIEDKAVGGKSADQPQPVHNRWNQIPEPDPQLPHALPRHRSDLRRRQRCHGNGGRHRRARHDVVGRTRQHEATRAAFTAALVGLPPRRR